MREKPARIDFRANTQKVSPAMVAATQRSTATALANRAKVVEEFGE